jgi:hypothetical protein
VTGLRRKYFRGLRPVVLVVALIAPAVLASGMLMAEITGFEATARGATNTAALHAQADKAAKSRAEAPATTFGGGMPGQAHEADQGSGHGSVSPHDEQAIGGVPTVGDVRGDAQALDPRGADNAQGAQGLPNAHAGREQGVLANGRRLPPGAAIAPPAAVPPGSVIAAPAFAAPMAPGIAPAVPVAGAVQNQVMEPTPVPAPAGPARVYGQLIIVRQPKAPAQPAANVRPGEAPPAQPSEKPQEGLTCALDWKDTWLWDLCKEDGGKVSAPAAPADSDTGKTLQTGS